LPVGEAEPLGAGMIADTLTSAADFAADMWPTLVIMVIVASLVFWKIGKAS
jgi:hypothetical protein